MERQNTNIRQEQIKKAVLHIIFTKGLKNLSTRNLAKEIGLSEGAIFRHFPTKQDIILSIINDAHEDFIGKLREVANSNLPPDDRLRKFIYTTINYIVDNKGIFMLMLSEANHKNDAELKNKLLQIFNSQKKLFSKIILDGIAVEIWDEKIPVDDLAMLYMGIPVSINIEQTLTGGEIHVEGFCGKVNQLMTKMLEKL